MTRATLFLIAAGLMLPLKGEQTTASRDYVIFLDTSGSMNQGGLFKRVQTELDRLLVGQVRSGDRVKIYSFDATVVPLVDRVIASASDLASVQGTVDQLKAKGQWTYLTMAFDIAAKDLDQLARSSGGQRERLVYILTDGKNEPPKGSGEAPITFDDIVRFHRATYTSEGTHLYLVTFGNELPAAEARAAHEAGAEVIPQPRTPTRPIFGVVQVSPKELDLVIPAGGSEIPPLALRLERQGGTSADTLNVTGRIVRGPSWLSLRRVSQTVLSGSNSSLPVAFQVVGTQTGSQTETAVLVVSASSRASKWAVAPESIQVRISVGRANKVRIDVPPMVILQRGAGDSVSGETKLIAHSEGGATNVDVRLSLNGPGSQVLRIAPDSVNLSTGIDTLSITIRGMLGDTLTMTGVHVSLPSGFVLDSLSQLAMTVHAPRASKPAESGKLGSGRVVLFGVLALLLVLAAFGLVIFRRPTFDPELRIEQLNENGETVQVISPAALQGTLRRPIVISRDTSVEGIEEAGVAIAPVAGGVKVTPIQSTLRASVNDDPVQELSALDGEVFIVGGIRFRVSAPPLPVTTLAVEPDQTTNPEEKN